MSFFLSDYFFSPPSSIDVLSECCSGFFFISVSVCRVIYPPSFLFFFFFIPFFLLTKQMEVECGSTYCLKSRKRSLNAVLPHLFNICRRSRIFFDTFRPVFDCNFSVLGNGQFNGNSSVRFFLTASQSGGLLISVIGVEFKVEEKRLAFRICRQYSATYHLARFSFSITWQ